jgi:hypothetical protein
MSRTCSTISPCAIITSSSASRHEQSSPTKHSSMASFFDGMVATKLLKFGIARQEFSFLNQAGPPERGAIQSLPFLPKPVEKIAQISNSWCKIA